MIKKTAALILVLCMFFCVSACKSNDCTYCSYHSSSKVESTAQSNSSENITSNTLYESVSSLEESAQQETVAENNTSSITEEIEDETTESLVWIPTKSGKKYHSKASCSNMKNPRQVTKSEAISSGFGACSKCN